MRVIVAVEHGEIAAKTAESIAAWARTSASEIVLLTVLHPEKVHATVKTVVYQPAAGVTPAGHTLNLASPPPFAIENRGQALARAHSEIEDWQRGLTARYFPGLPVAYRVEVGSETARMIAALAEEEGADLIVMGSHGRKGLGHAVFGSVAEAVVRQSPVPVLVVGPGARARSMAAA